MVCSLYLKTGGRGGRNIRAAPGCAAGNLAGLVRSGGSLPVEHVSRPGQQEKQSGSRSAHSGMGTS